MTARILVIRLSALGDVVLSFGPFAAIRAHHPDARLCLLTSAPFAPLLAASPWFDEIRIDQRPPWWNLPAIARLARQLRGFDLVYDLQTSARSNRYYRLAGRPAWSGIAPGCSLPHRDPARNHLHTCDRQRGQLRDAGISDFPPPDLDFLRQGGPVIDGAYVVLVPGTSGAHGGAKTWPRAHFAALAAILAQQGLRPVLVGGKPDQAAAAEIAGAVPRAVNLAGQTGLRDLAGLLARARAVVGADTGPLHLAAALATPSLVLFGPATDPALTAPRAPDPNRLLILRSDKNIGDLSPQRVAAALADL